MDREFIDSIFKKIKAYSTLKFPKYEIPSIPEEGLVSSDNDSLISFDIGVYDKNTKTLKFNNAHKFQGEIDNKNEKYFLKNGIYYWPSGQIYNGEFNKNNLFEDGELKKDDYSYKGKFKNGIFEGEGEFRLNKKDFIKGTFKNGEIKGKANVRKDNFIITGDFEESKPYGKIDKYYLEQNNNKYEFENFNFQNGKIKDEYIEFKKNGKKLNYFRNIEQLDIEPNMEEYTIDDNELSQLEQCLNLINIKLPKFELPKFHKEGLIMVKEEFPILKFKNGEEADIDDDKDENELKVPNGENFIGRIYYEEEDKKYYLKEGKYFWPSGQEYEGKFNKDYKFETDTENSKLSIKNKWSYKGKFKDGKFYDKGILEFADDKKYDAYFEDNKIVGSITIKCNNIEIKANVQNSLISGITANIKDKNYKINDIKLNNNIKEPILIVKEDDSNGKKYAIIFYQINNSKIELGRLNILPRKEFENILEILNKKIELPIFEQNPLNENSLKKNEKKNLLSFEKNIYYDKNSKTLNLPNGETFKGELIQDGNKYYFYSGEYSWPSGQKYEGKFNDNYNFHSEEENSSLITKEYTYNGKFKYGIPSGEGEIKWENGNIIKGIFLNGKYHGNTYIKNDNISFEAKYINSIIVEYIKNIKILNQDTPIIDKLNIEKGKIKESTINIDNNTIVLTEENRTLLSNKEYKKVEYDEEDIILILKVVDKIRKISLPNYEQPRIAEDGIYIENINNLENINLSFPNDESFLGKIQKLSKNKYMLIEGKYDWPNGQSYIGKFEKNRFNDENGKLYFSPDIYYEGGFKYGLFHGNGIIKSSKEFFEGFFEEGEIINLNLKNKSIIFEGKNLDSIKELYISLFKGMIKDNFYEISDFNINKEYINYKRDNIDFKIEFSQELKQKIVEIFLMKNRTMTNFRNYFYNNQYIKNLSNENKIKVLKIENNIYSRKLSKISIYKNRLADENRNRKNEINKIVGANISNMMTIQEIDYRLNSMKNLRKKINNNPKLRKSMYNCNFNSIEKMEISRIFNHKMMKEMKKEIDLLKKDIITLKNEKQVIEKERNNRQKEIHDLNFYFSLINNNYNQLTKVKNKLDNEAKELQEKLNQVYNENYILNKYLKNGSGKINNEELKKNIREIEIDNNRLISEIKENKKKINEQNKEKEELLKQIEEYQNSI